MARDFASVFGAPDWGYLAGLYHDLGKYSEVFQTRLLALNDPDAHIEVFSRPDHSTAGAQHVYRSLKDPGKILAYAIAGHHAGLPDGKANNDSCLSERLNKQVPDYSRAPKSVFDASADLTLPFALNARTVAFQLSFFIRMLFSCVVDADFIDTERFMQPERAGWRGVYPSLEELDQRAQGYMLRLHRHARSSSVNHNRATIFHQCMKASSWSPGLFSLTVPTGGGKTLSSFAFALKHALTFGLDRIIYVIPYTSIIEQNAAIFRSMLGGHAVLEHHSNFDPGQEDHWSRLASENWDAPVVVTTNVQFFESLFGSRTSRCRKLHNVARSVVILDEAQMLPVSLLKPCIEALRELSSSYGTSVVLCTATQPALSSSSQFKGGLDNVREIIPDPRSLYTAFKRVTVSYLSTVTDADLTTRLAKHPQVLCIVSTRSHARRLFELMPAHPGLFHLSALMCPAHRSVVLARIREALKEGRPCRVISTQLIEAGVDIDFPVVYRSIAGTDSIAQAAGRCNREGIFTTGHVYVFNPENRYPPGPFRLAAQTAEQVMDHHPADPLSLEAVEEYFRTLYWTRGEKLDERQILALIKEGIHKGDYPFREIDKQFKLIEEVMEAVIIPWNDQAEDLIAQLRQSEYTRAIARRLQQFTVQVRPVMLDALFNAGAIGRVRDQYNVLTNKAMYREDVGLSL
jgi:CRISPR-associated endonuclease/helicase Cas3